MRELCLCTHSKIAHNLNTGCLVLGCECRHFKARVIETAPPVKQAQTLKPLDASADRIFDRINGKAGFSARRTPNGIQVTAYVGGHIQDCKRVEARRVTVNGETLIAAFEALIQEVSNG